MKPYSWSCGACGKSGNVMIEDEVTPENMVNAAFGDHDANSPDCGNRDIYLRFGHSLDQEGLLRKNGQKGH